MIDLLRNRFWKVLVVLLPLLLALAPAKAQNTAYQNKVTTLSVISFPGHTYEWELYNDSSVDFALVSGNCPASMARFVSGNYGSSVDVIWLEPGTYFFKVTARDGLGCAMNLKVGIMNIISFDPQAIITGTTVSGACEQITLNASKSIGKIIKYEWSPIDKGGVLTKLTGPITEFHVSPDYLGTLPADFRVRLVVTDSIGAISADTVTLKVDRLPIADIYYSGKLEKDGTMIVDGTVSKGSSLNYRWFTIGGKVIGDPGGSTVNLLGAGTYTLEVTDEHGCKSTKSFKYPLENNQIFANADYVRTSWARDTIVPVLNNDFSTAKLMPHTIQILQQPVRGKVKINPNGTITYTPTVSRPSRDMFIYQICDEVNLCASATVIIDIYDSGIIAPEGFSPNGDGSNETLVFKGLENYPQSQLHVYTRAGQLVYQSEDYRNDWDAKINTGSKLNGQIVPTGTYYYILKLGGTERVMKGFVYIGY
ncbi:MAG: gliding motility-associated C-terminal domain-containing protein [Mariniphaga sp.]